MSSLFYDDADMIKNICILDVLCERRRRVLELEDDEVQMIINTPLRICMVWEFLPACVRGIGGRGRSGNVSG